MAKAKPPILFCHGMWANAACFDRLKGYFEARGHRCYAPTLPLHDIAPSDPAPAGLGDLPLTVYLDALHSHVRAIGEQPVIVGHSMGGLLAQLLGARGLGRAVIALAPAPMAGTNTTLPEPTRALWPIMGRWGFWEKPHKPDWKTVRWAVFNNVPEEEARHWFDQYVWESGRALYQIAFWWADGAKASRVDAKQVDVPVQIIVGDQDRITPRDFARHAAARYFQVDYSEIREAGHWIIGEPWWQDTAARMDAFIRTV